MSSPVVSSQLNSSLSVQENQLASNDRVTLAKLLSLGFGGSGAKHVFSAESLRTAGLSTNALVALVRASAPRVVDGGVEVRPKMFIAKEVTVYDSGAADITLALELVG
jgi:hypothetical protein